MQSILGMLALAACVTVTEEEGVGATADPVDVVESEDAAPVACPAYAGFSESSTASFAEEESVRWEDGLAYSVAEKTDVTGTAWSRDVTRSWAGQAGSGGNVKTTSFGNCDTEGAWVNLFRVESWSSNAAGDGESVSIWFVPEMPILVQPTELGPTSVWFRLVTGSWIQRDEDPSEYAAFESCAVVEEERLVLPSGAFDTLHVQCTQAGGLEDRWLDEERGTVAMGIREDETPAVLLSSPLDPGDGITAE